MEKIIKKSNLPRFFIFCILCVLFVSIGQKDDSVFAASGNNAQFIGQSVPLSMVAGQAYPVSIIMANTGTTSWTEADKYRLGSQNPQDNTTWGIGRVFLSAGEAVAPGSSKTFNFSVKAPDSPGVYNFSWEMLRESVEWFGGAAPVALVNVTAGTETPLPKSQFDYNSFAGANVLESAACWIPDDAQTDTIMQSAKKMGLRVLRLPVVVQSTSNNDCWGMNHIKSFLDKAEANGFKVIIELDGYAAYQGKCDWKQGFTDVKSEAEKIVTALKDHPALFAWDLLNEPLWTVDNYCIGVDHASVIKAVDAMHDLVRSIDSRTPLTVGEGKDEYLGEWNTITNFASPHIYGIRYDTAHAGVDFQNRIGNLKSQAGSLPMVVGEFGIVVPDQASETDRVTDFSNMYRVMKDENVGGMFWLLSTSSDQQSMSPINSDGSLKPTGNAIMQALGVVTISGKVADDFGRGLPNVTIELCGAAANPTTDANGNWSASVASGASYCARVASGLPAGYSAVKGTGNNSCHVNNNSYEWQIAGQNIFQNCSALNSGSWDLATDGNLNFTIDYGNAETIDTLDYFVTKHPDKALTGTHALSQTIVGNSSYYAKAGAPDKFFEYHTWDNNYVYLTEDTAGYTFSPGIWMKRKMAVGEKLDEPGNLIRRYDNNVDCNYQSVPQPFPYSMTLLDHIKFDIGGDLGNQDVIRLKYDYSSGANSDYEIFYYSKEWGWIQWEYYHNGSLVSKSVFNKIDPNPPAQIFAGNLCTIRDKNKLLYPNMTCNPGSFRNCKICNSNGSAWVDASSKCVAVLGKVVTSAGQPVPDVKIALCDQGFATTNSKGGWSVFVTPGRSYCARIDSGLPPGYVAIAASNSRNCQANNPSYEWQVAGRNEFVGCFATENQAWDLSDDDSLDFTINYAKKCNAKNCSSLNYECGTANDGCGGVLDCGICASGKTCSAGVCVAASSGGGGGGGNPTPPITPVSTKPVKQMTRAEILAAIARIRALIADLQKQLTALTGTTTSTFSCTQITKNLFYSISNDPQVKCLQEILKSQGYTVVVSGNYDAATKAAVALFQQKYASEILAPYHLTRGSGNVGNATRSKINSFIVIK